MSKTFFTRKGFAIVQEEIVRLQEEIEECNRKIGRTVDLDNDLRENPEFMALRTKAEYELPSRIQKLSKLITNSVIIETLPHLGEVEPDYIDVGHEITLIADNSEQRIVTILGYGDSNPDKQIVSYLTPIGQALLHKEIGEEVTLPYRGKTIHYEIDDIRVSPLLKANSGSQDPN